MLGFNARKPQDDTVIVEMLKNDLPYLKGEIAGFPRHIAERLISKGYAQVYGDGKPQATGGRVPDAPESGYLSPPMTTRG